MVSLIVRSFLPTMSSKRLLPLQGAFAAVFGLMVPAARSFAMSATLKPQHFCITCFDKENSLPLRLANRESHLAFANNPPSGKVGYITSTCSTTS
jgi:hypothetical protein